MPPTALAGLTVERFEAGVGSIACNPTVEAARRHAKLTGYLIEGPTPIDFQQGQHPSEDGGIVG
jgi:hypothetical protein